MAEERRGMVPVEEVREAKRVERERLERNVAAFLARGGTITRIPAGVATSADAKLYNNAPVRRKRKAKVNHG